MNRSNRAGSIAARALAATAAVLLLGLALGCGDDSGGGGPAGPTFTTNDMVEASSGVAVSTILSLTSLASDIPGLGDGRSLKLGRARGPLAIALDVARAGLAHGKRRTASGAAVPEPCSDGGTVDKSCIVMEGVSGAQVAFANCREFDSETNTTTTVNGTLSASVADPTFCDTGEIADGVDVSIGLDGFSSTVRDAENQIVERTTANLTVAVDATGAGCAGPNTTLSMDGSLTTFSALEGVDATLVADGLTLAATSSGAPCVGQLVADGSLSLVDRVTDRHFTQSFGEFTLTFALLPNTRVQFTIDGEATVDCLGLVTFDTIEPILFVGNADCPAAGLLQITLAGGHASRIGFTAAGGIEFDYDADGDVDRTFESCGDPMIKRCPA